MLVLVFLLVYARGAVWVRAVLKGLFRLTAEVERRGEPDGLFERVCWVLEDEEVYESGYATK